MKDLTYYFNELPKVNETSTMDCDIEVRRERAKSSPKKRERVKIKITNTSSGSVECEIVENNQNLVDKTPSPVCNGQTSSLHWSNNPRSNRRHSKCNNGHNSDVPKQVKENVEIKSNLEDMRDDNSNEMTTKKTLMLISKKNKEKLMTSTRKKGSDKRKSNEIEEEYKDNNGANEKKKQELKKDYCNNRNIMNGQKNACSLLNYFSKATPDQIEQEKISKATFVVKAEIHENNKEKLIPETLFTPKLTLKQKRANNIKSIMSTADDIEIISSEDISPCMNSESFDSDLNSPLKNNITSKLCKTPKNKPKWSMKIKLNLNENDNNDIILTDSTFDEDIFTPKRQLQIDSDKNKVKSDEKSWKRDRVKLKKEKPSKHNNQYLRDKSKITLKSDKSKSVSPKEQTNDSLCLKEIIESTETSPKITEKLAPIFTRKISSKESNVIVEETLKRKQTEKLAPLFVKRYKPDPDVLAARQQFLQPEIIDLTNYRVPLPKTQVLPQLSIFPKISHVTQLSETSEKNDFKATFTLKPFLSYKPLLNFEEMKSINSFEITDNKIKHEIKEIKTDAETETVVNEIELRCKNAKKIWSRISNLGEESTCKNGELKQKKKRGRPKKHLLELEKSMNEIKQENAINGMIWTSKYKPTCSSEIIGNEDAVKKLKDWLNSWRSKVEDRENSDTDEDFYTSDCSQSSFCRKNQVAVLTGPHGCGKTSSVYAIAEELGYRVIEVNASSKRPGKKILKDLEEATKSHRIHNNSIESSGFGKQLINKKIIQKNSLILLDDIDLIFEEDDGFMNAAFQLASNTKRPIAMTCKNIFSQLSKFAPQQLRINFEAVPYKKASTFLELVSLAETNCRLPVSCSEALTITGDLRKALLQLQYLLLSGRTISTSIIKTIYPSMWREMHNSIYRPVIKAKKLHKKKSQEQKDKEAVSDTTKANLSLLQELTNNIDNISLILGLANRRDVAFETKDHTLEDSLSVSEKMNYYSKSEKLGSDIYEWITHYTFNRNNSVESKNIAHLDNLLLKKNINEGVNMTLTQTIAPTLDRRAISTDYLPYVRAICRSEDIRQNNNAKRGNRFYHYLQNIVTVRPHVFTAACKIFQEKQKDKT